MTDLLARDAKVVLRPNADTTHQDAAYWYACYGAHISTEAAGDVEVQAVDPEWLAQDLDDEEIAAKIREECAAIAFSSDELEELISLARQVWDAATTVCNLLDTAVEDYTAGDLDGVLEHLRAAREVETEHGDDPATSELVEKLIEPKTAWRVYCCPDGCCASYCGEYDTQEEAEAIAESEPVGLEESLWATARAAGHCAGMTAPGDGEEDEPLSWHGAAGYHCVVKVIY